MMRVFTVVAIPILLAALNMGQRNDGPAQRVRAMDLPEPRTKGGTSLTETLAARRSVREFTGDSLNAASLGQLCWAAQGITSAVGYRTAPSAGALFPIELFVATPRGLGQYDPSAHRLIWKKPDDLRATLRRHALGQAPVGAAPACFIIVADIERTAAKYGARAERYCMLEAGHVCQNILLQATAMKLGGVPIGAFDDQKIAQDLNLPESHRPLYLVPVGHPGK